MGAEGFGGGRLDIGKAFVVSYSRIANGGLVIKGQDILVLVSLMGDNAGLAYAELGKRSRLSVSETHAAVKRLVECGLVKSDRHLIKSNVMEFLAHGLKYAFPLKASGRLGKGMPTAYAAPVAESEFVSTGMVPVWSGSGGNVYGQMFEPIYATAPEAAGQDAGMYDRLALVDMLRGGRLRERIFAERKLKEML